MQHPLSSLKGKNRAALLKLVKELGRPGIDSSGMKILAEVSTNDEDPSFRLEAVKSLGRVGREAVPILMQNLMQEDAHVRREATTSLGKLGADSAAAVPGLVQALRDKDTKVRMGAATALGQIGPAAREAIPQLIEALRDSNLILCRLAAQALSLMGTVAVAPLTDALRHNDMGVRREAAWALGQIGPDAKASVAALSELLGPGQAGAPAPTTMTRPSAEEIATAVISMSPPKSDDTQVIAELAMPGPRESNAKVRQAVAQALERIQGKA